MKLLLNIGGADQDGLLNLYLDIAKDKICDIRYTMAVEPQYVNTQVQIALELYNKMGVEGQLSHSENGIDRGYENSGISKSLLDGIIPCVKTPFSVVRQIGDSNENV